MTGGTPILGNLQMELPIDSELLNSIEVGYFLSIRCQNLERSHPNVGWVLHTLVLCVMGDIY